MSGFHPFAKVVQAPSDKILGLKEEFLKDSRPDKIDLSIGVYRGDDGRTRLLEVVSETKRALNSRVIAPNEDPSSRVEYIPITGYAPFCRAAQELIFGADSASVKEGRIVTIQTIGGTGGIRVGADFLKRHVPSSTVYNSSPTWVNHRSIFQRAGFEVASYPYFDSKTKAVVFDEMYDCLSKVEKQSIVVLQAACHNPTGFDLQPEQWASLAELTKKLDLIPFFDFAYQGFDSGLAEDGRHIRAFVDAGISFFVVGSFSKNFSLYNSRIGTLSVVTQSAEEAARVASQIKTDIRATYSSPALDPAELVSTILSDPKLRSRWEAEVAAMRARIAEMRSLLLKHLTDRGQGERFRHLGMQRGLFFYSGLTADQMARLKSEFGIYGVDDGRICIAAITPKTVEQIADAMAKVAG